MPAEGAEVAQTAGDPADAAPIGRGAYRGQQRVIDDDAGLEKEVCGEEQHQRGDETAADEEGEQAAADDQTHQQRHAPRQPVGDGADPGTGEEHQPHGRRC